MRESQQIQQQKKFKLPKPGDITTKQIIRFLLDLFTNKKTDFLK